MVPGAVFFAQHSPPAQAVFTTCCMTSVSFLARTWRSKCASTYRLPLVPSARHRAGSRYSVKTWSARSFLFSGSIQTPSPACHGKHRLQFSKTRLRRQPPPAVPATTTPPRPAPLILREMRQARCFQVTVVDLLCVRERHTLFSILDEVRSHETHHEESPGGCDGASREGKDSRRGRIIGRA